MGNYFPEGSAGLWIVLAIVFYEGLLGGAAYVNTFYKITKEVCELSHMPYVYFLFDNDRNSCESPFFIVQIPPERREFSVGAVSIADSLGIATAGAISIPVHNLLCSMKDL